MRVRETKPIAHPVRPAIAFFLQGLKIGGMERGTLQLATSARRQGHNVSIVVYEDCLTGGADEFDPGDIPVTALVRQRGLDPILPFRLAELFRRSRVQLVHARNNVAGFYAALSLKFMVAAPRLIITFDTCPGKEQSTKARLASLWASSRAACVSSVSQNMSARLLQSRWTTSCVSAWNGVDTRVFNPEGPTAKVREKLGLSPGTLLVGHVSRLDANKRQIDLLAAFQRVQQMLPNVALVIAGDGPAWQALAHAAKAVNNVFLLGIVRDVPSLLRDLDIFVLCSDDEGCPFALLEAMSCQRPVVATAVGGIPEIVADAGVLVPPRHPDVLADAIAMLCSSHELRQSFGRAARQRVLQFFTVEEEWRRYRRIYQSALQTPPFAGEARIS